MKVGERRRSENRESGRSKDKVEDGKDEEGGKGGKEKWKEGGEGWKEGEWKERGKWC